MIYTSYFANQRKLAHLKKVSISRFPPKWFQADEYALELAPSKELLNEYKNGNVSDEEYDEIYKQETLSKLNPEDIFHKYDGAVLLCYEKTGDFCHRNIVSQWLQENGFEAGEF